MLNWRRCGPLPDYFRRLLVLTTVENATVLRASYSIAGHHQCLFTYYKDRSELDTKGAAAMRPFTVSTVATCCC